MSALHCYRTPLHPPPTIKHVSFALLQNSITPTTNNQTCQLCTATELHYTHHQQSNMSALHCYRTPLHPPPTIKHVSFALLQNSITPTTNNQTCQLCTATGLHYTHHQQSNMSALHCYRTPLHPPPIIKHVSFALLQNSITPTTNNQTCQLCTATELHYTHHQQSNMSALHCYRTPLHPPPTIKHVSFALLQNSITPTTNNQTCQLCTATGLHYTHHQQSNMSALHCYRTPLHPPPIIKHVSFALLQDSITPTTNNQTCQL